MVIVDEGAQSKKLLIRESNPGKRIGNPSHFRYVNEYFYSS